MLEVFMLDSCFDVVTRLEIKYNQSKQAYGRKDSDASFGRSLRQSSYSNNAMQTVMLDHVTQTWKCFLPAPPGQKIITERLTSDFVSH